MMEKSFHIYSDKELNKHEKEREKLEILINQIESETDLKDIESLRKGCEKLALLCLFETLKHYAGNFPPNDKTLVRIYKVYDTFINGKQSNNTYIQNNITLNTFNYLDRMLYENLNENFTLQDALKVGKGLGYAERTIKRTLSENKVLFERIKKGCYRKKPLQIAGQ